MGAFIPSIRLYLWLEEATLGVFADRISNGSIALAAKLPASVIKAVHDGSAVDILGAVVAVDGRNVPCFAMRVHDEVDSPFIGMRGFLRDDEGQILSGALASDLRRLHFFDELSRHVLSCDISVDGVAASQLRRHVEEAGGFVAVDEELHERAVEVAEHRIKGTGRHADDAYPVWDILPVTVERLDSAEYYGVSTTASFGPFRLDAADEGGLFEDTVHELADEVYGKRAYRSPRAALGRKSVNSRTSCSLPMIT